VTRRVVPEQVAHFALRPSVEVTEERNAEQRAVDSHLYRERNLFERFWSNVKQCRRVATRYEKKAANFLAFVKMAAIMVMLQ
jgi:transposase